MHREGHYGVTLLLATPLLFLTSLNVALAGAGIMLLVTTFPDKDHRLQSWAEDSTILRLLPGGGRVQSAFRHRGVMHTFLVGALFGFGVGVAVSVPLKVASVGDLNPELLGGLGASPNMIGVFVALMIIYAWIGHIYADALTVGSGKYGVKPYWPFSRKQVRFGYFKAANKWANGGFLLGGLVAFGAALYFKVVYLGAISIPV